MAKDLPHIAIVIGTRPQLMKTAPLVKALQGFARTTVIDTGQHYDWKMSGQHFHDLGLAKPRYNLAIGSSSHAVQTAGMMVKLEPLLIRLKPACVVVFGDTNSTVAAALTSAKLHIPIIHIEAGMRSFDRAMPEEINRVITDHLSRVLFCPSHEAEKNLFHEGITKNVFVVGDNMLDPLFANRSKALTTTTILRHLNIKPRHFLLFTLHRAGNIDIRERLKGIIDAILKIEETIVFPMHPRTKKMLQQTGLWGALSSYPLLRIIEPVGYLDMLALLSSCRVVLTDSGGIQKEAFSLKIPCITLRDNTEWHETVTQKWNILVGADTKRILRAVKEFRPPKHHVLIYGNGHASVKIVKKLLRVLPHIDG